MKRASRKKVIAPIPTLGEQIKQRKLEAKRDKQNQWLAYLEKVGSTPLAPGSKELDEAIAWVESLILDCCTEQDQIELSFQFGCSHELPFFPSDETLGTTKFATKFRRLASANLTEALRKKHPPENDLSFMELYQGISIMW